MTITELLDTENWINEQDERERVVVKDLAGNVYYDAADLCADPAADYYPNDFETPEWAERPILMTHHKGGGLVEIVVC